MSASWEIAFGETHPIVIDVTPSMAHDGWQPPAFSVGAGAGASAIHDARHVAKALTVPGAESARVLRDEVDSAGRRHLTVGDEFGHELARSVLVHLGFSEGEPESPQKKIPGTLHPIGGATMKVTVGGKSVVVDERKLRAVANRLDHQLAKNRAAGGKAASKKKATKPSKGRGKKR